MPAQQRRPATGIVRRLLAQPQRYQLAQALRLLLQWLRRAGIPSGQAFRQVLRFQNSVALGFPPSDIEALHAAPDALAGAWDARPLPQLQLTPALLGFLGVHGVLPYHYAERIAVHAQHGKDDGARAFLDILSNRLVALYYQGWAKYRLEHGLDTGGHDALLPMLLALSGARCPGPDAGAVAGYYAGLLRQRPLSASAIARILDDYLGVPVRVQPLTGAWQAIDAARQCRLGGPNAVLGASGVLGVRRWRHGASLRLWIGPLERDAYARFLPGAPGALALRAMLALMDLPGVRCEAQLILKAACVQPLRLDAHACRRLGWDSFLCSGPAAADKADVRYTVYGKGNCN